MAARLLDDEFIARLDRLELVSRKIVLGKLRGERLSARKGQSTEFSDHRPYTPGDDLRFLDWNIWVRLDRLFTKVFLEEEDLCLDILIDASASMRFGEPDKFLYARRLAAALGYVGLVHHDRVRIARFAERFSGVFGPARGRRQARRLLEVLGSMEAADGGTTDLTRSCREFALTSGRSGILALVTDFLDRRGAESALRYLAAAGRSLEVFVFHVLSPQETDPEITGDLRLVDSEDGRSAEVSISRPLLDAYRRRLGEFREDVRAQCSRRGMHYIFSPTTVDFDRLVLDYLRRRGLLR